jgi:hypothetical protein
MIELSQLFQDLEAQVVQQEPAVTQIEQRGEEVNDHVAKANTELDGAVKKARSARRKKWWCFLIVGMFSTSMLPRVSLANFRFSHHHYHHRSRRGCWCLCFTKVGLGFIFSLFSADDYDNTFSYVRYSRAIRTNTYQLMSVCSVLAFSRRIPIKQIYWARLRGISLTSIQKDRAPQYTAPGVYVFYVLCWACPSFCAYLNPVEMGSPQATLL